MNEIAAISPTEPFKPAPRAANCKSSAPVVRVKTAAEFCAEYVPLDYAVEGIVRTASLYCVTAPTGAGKTAFNVASALAVATGRTDILGRDVVHGRVAYL